MKTTLVFLFLSVSAFASEIDLKLQDYVKNFGLRPLPALPARNQALFTLGQRLFMSPLLSGNKNISCAHCHHPGVMTHDALPLGLGEGAMGIQVGQGSRRQLKGKILARNTPALFNLHGVSPLFWDGRVSYDSSTKEFQTPLPDLNGPHPKRRDITQVMTSALAAQAIFPIVDFAEMRGESGSNKIADAPDEFSAWELVIEQLMEVEIFRESFAKAFPGQKINIGHVGEALAEFQAQAFALNDTPYDRYLKGDKEALSDSQKRGMDVFFNKASCGNCHKGEHLSSFGFENVGIPQIGPGKKDGDDLGRQEFDPSAGPYQFRVPPLRNSALTAPFMHSGVFQTITEVITHYENVMHSLRHFSWVQEWPNYVEEIEGHDHINDRKRLQTLSPLLQPRIFLSAEEKADLEDFLVFGLTDYRLQRRLRP